jgi:hypothetical protein
MQVGNCERPISTGDRPIIEALARETGTELPLVKTLYEQALAQLETDAKVRGFLSVLACRSVRNALRERYAHTN